MQIYLGTLLVTTIVALLPASAQAGPKATDKYGEPLPDGVLARIGISRWQPAAVTALAFSPDGAILASGGKDKRISFWQTSTGKKIATLYAHPEEIAGLAFADNGKILVSANKGGNIFLWNARTHKLLRQLAGVLMIQRSRISLSLPTASGCSLPVKRAPPWSGIPRPCWNFCKPKPMIHWQTLRFRSCRCRREQSLVCRRTLKKDAKPLRQRCAWLNRLSLGRHEQSRATDHKPVKLILVRVPCRNGGHQRTILHDMNDIADG